MAKQITIATDGIKLALHRVAPVHVGQLDINCFVIHSYMLFCFWLSMRVFHVCVCKSIMYCNLQKHIGMITFQARLGAHLYVANGIRWWWNTVDLMGGLLVEELGASALVAIEDRIVRAVKHRNQFSLYTHTDYGLFTHRSIKSVSCPLG